VGPVPSVTAQLPAGLQARDGNVTIIAPPRRGDEEVGLQRKAVVRVDLHVSTCGRTDAVGENKK